MAEEMTILLQKESIFLIVIFHSDEVNYPEFPDSSGGSRCYLKVR